MEISVPEHTIYFNGYLDAVGRVYTTDSTLYVLSALIISEDSSLENQLEAKIVESNEVKDIVRDFESGVSELLKTDPRERLIFYLVEYFSWFEEYTKSCKCVSYKLEGENIPPNHIAYTLNVNNKYNVLIYLCILEKNA